MRARTFYSMALCLLHAKELSLALLAEDKNTKKPRSINFENC